MSSTTSPFGDARRGPRVTEVSASSITSTWLLPPATGGLRARVLLLPATCSWSPRRIERRRESWDVSWNASGPTRRGSRSAELLAMQEPADFWAAWCLCRAGRSARALQRPRHPRDYDGDGEGCRRRNIRFRSAWGATSSGECLRAAISRPWGSRTSSAVARAPRRTGRLLDRAAEGGALSTSTSTRPSGRNYEALGGARCDNPRSRVD